MKFRVLAESKRVIPQIKARDIVANCIAAEKMHQYHVVYWFYSAIDKKRMSDEDLREMFLHLTDAYPEEVMDDPDLIQILADLSKTDRTEIESRHVCSVISMIINADDNEQRARLIAPLFSRIDQRDMREIIMRISNRSSSISRSDVVFGLAKANGELYRRVKKASLLVGMERVCNLFSMGESISEIIKPVLGAPLLIPSPSVFSLKDVPFGECFSSKPEGVWCSAHVENGKCILMDSSGNVMEETTIPIPDGIWLVEYAAGRNQEIQIIDRLNCPDGGLDFKNRRASVETLLGEQQHWLLKKMEYHESALSIDTEGATLLWNARGVLSFENSPYEVVLVQMKPQNTKVMRLISGLWVQLHEESNIHLGKWRVGARDGNSYFPIGVIPAKDDDIRKQLTKFCEETKAVVGAEASVMSPVFVDVEMVSTGWGDYGPYVDGVIKGINRTAGINECMSVIEIEMLEGDYSGG